MPTVSRARNVRAPPDEVWRVVTEPARLPGWWPGVTRVEEATPEAWTTVASSPKGRTLRADYTRLAAEPGRWLAWRHELGESPFERILSESTTIVALEPVAGGGTRVELTVRLRARGLARLGFLQLQLAAGRQVEGALDGLVALLGEQGRP